MALRYTSSDFLSDLRLTSFHKRGLSFAVCLSGPAPNETLNAPGKVFHVRRLRHQEPLRGLARLRDLALRRRSQGYRAVSPRLMVVGSGAISLRTSFALDIGTLLESIPATGNSVYESRWLQRLKRKFNSK